MGYQVQKLPTGDEVEVHVMVSKDAAEQYVTKSRGYKFDRHEPWAFTSGYDFYQGAGTERASIYQKRVNGELMWHVAFWERN